MHRVCMSEWLAATNRHTNFGYQRYVELVKNSLARACNKCCDDPADSPLDKNELRYQY